jgi:hypothetical protein
MKSFINKSYISFTKKRKIYFKKLWFCTKIIFLLLFLFFTSIVNKFTFIYFLYVEKMIIFLLVKHLIYGNINIISFAINVLNE